MSLRSYVHISLYIKSIWSINLTSTLNVIVNQFVIFLLEVYKWITVSGTPVFGWDCRSDRQEQCVKSECAALEESRGLLQTSLRVGRVAEQVVVVFCCLPVLVDCAQIKLCWARGADIYIYRHALRLMCFWCGTEILKLRCSLLVRGSHQLRMFPGAARSVGVWTHLCHRSGFGVVKSTDQHMQPDGQPQEALPKCPDDCSWKYFCTVGLCLVIGLLVLVPSGLQLGSGQ